jgi:hypothetical protein
MSRTKVYLDELIWKLARIPQHNPNTHEKSLVAVLLKIPYGQLNPKASDPRLSCSQYQKITVFWRL